jgi:hypothetical protein
LGIIKLHPYGSKAPPPTPYGRFSRHWQDEEALDVLIGKLAARQFSYKQALVHIPKGFKGQITWSEVDNRPFLRLAHWYQAALIAFREEDHVAACTYLRLSVAANP